MPTQFDELIAGVYDYLGVSKNQLKLTTVAQKVLDTLNWSLTLLNLTDQNWIVGRSELVATAPTDEYTLAITNYGRAIFAEITAGTNVSNEEGSVKTQVPVFDIQDGQLPDVPFTASGEPGLAIWRDTTGAFKVRVVPSLDEGITRTYQIWYEPAVVTPAAITSNPGLIEQAYGLVKAKAALSCLPLCNFRGEAYTQRRDMLTADKMDYESAFREYILIDSNETAGVIQGFNSTRTYGDGF